MKKIMKLKFCSFHFSFYPTRNEFFLSSLDRINFQLKLLLTKFHIVVDVIVDVLWCRCWGCIGCDVGLLWWCEWRRQISWKLNFIGFFRRNTPRESRLLPAACCCCAGGCRCRNGWLKKTSKGIRSLALRRSRPKRRSWSSGVVPTGTLKKQN